MKRLSRHIITVLALLLTMSFYLVAQDELTPITTLLDQAQSALEDDDLSTAQSLFLGASALITPELETTCDTLTSAKTLLDQAASAESVETATSLLTSAQTLISSCSETSGNDDWTPVERDFDGVTMVLVPAGSFEMGSTDAEIDLAVELCNEARQDGETCPESFFTDETPTNIQDFAEPFWIDRTKVTRAQYQRCVDTGVCEETPDSDFSTADDQPINRVTWFQAQTYCEWRGDSARLPTEAEWEYAARGPDRLIFPWGNEFDGSLANHCDSNCADADWAANLIFTSPDNDDGFEVTAPVASFDDGVSWVGALDMSGNVWEWTSTIYDQDNFPYPYDEADGREDDNNSTSIRVVRGGSLLNTSNNLRAANRNRLNPNDDYDFIGFRCVRPVAAGD